MSEIALSVTPEEKLLLTYAIDYYGCTDGANEGACASLRDKLESVDEPEVVHNLMIRKYDVGNVGYKVLSMMRQAKELDEQGKYGAWDRVKTDLCGIIKGLVLAGWRVDVHPSPDSLFGTVEIEGMSFRV